LLGDGADRFGPSLGPRRPGRRAETQGGLPAPCQSYRGLGAIQWIGDRLGQEEALNNSAHCYASPDQSPSRDHHSQMLAITHDDRRTAEEARAWKAGRDHLHEGKPREGTATSARPRAIPETRCRRRGPRKEYWRLGIAPSAPTYTLPRTAARLDSRICADCDAGKGPPSSSRPDRRVRVRITRRRSTTFS